MRHQWILLLGLIASSSSLAQTAQTNCYPTAPTAPPASQSVTCATQVIPGIQAPQMPNVQLNPHSFQDSFYQGQQAALREQTLRLETELAAEQQRALERQQQLRPPPLSEQQIAAEAAVYRYAFVAVLQEQLKLPAEKRLSGEKMAQKAAEDAHAALGYDIHVEALDVAAKQLEAAMQRIAR